jgi:hypothetical protein
MPSFSGLLIVVAVAFAAPFVLGLFPRAKLPLDLWSAAEGAALIGAGLLSVLIFPLVGLALLREPAPAPAPMLAK